MICIEIKESTKALGNMLFEKHGDGIESVNDNIVVKEIIGGMYLLHENGRASWGVLAGDVAHVTCLDRDPKMMIGEVSDDAEKMLRSCCPWHVLSLNFQLSKYIIIK